MSMQTKTSGEEQPTDWAYNHDRRRLERLGTCLKCGGEVQEYLAVVWEPVKRVHTRIRTCCGGFETRKSPGTIVQRPGPNGRPCPFPEQGDLTPKVAIFDCHCGGIRRMTDSDTSAPGRTVDVCDSCEYEDLAP
jgi:hypothetical protein